MTTTSLVKQILAERRHSGYRCGVDVVLGLMTPERAAEWRAAFAELKGQGCGTSISRLLAAEGYSVTAGTINRHLRGDCSCR